VIGRYEKWQMDLIDMRKYSEHNDDINYLLTIIDVFTKYAHVNPLSNKTSSEVSKALYDLFSLTNPEMRPKILQSDNGSEFIAKDTKRICEHFGIIQIFSYPYSPLGYIERFNGTIKRKIFSWLEFNKEGVFYDLTDDRDFAMHHPLRYIDNLQDIVLNYNHSIHSSIREQPFTAHFCDEHDRRCIQIQSNIFNYLKRRNDRNPVILFPYQAGDTVNILSFLNPFISNLEKNKIKQNFKKVSTQKWTSDVFVIIDVQQDESNNSILRYSLKDKFNHPIKRKFYHHELQKVNY
jgi:hypothetical protein